MITCTSTKGIPKIPCYIHSAALIHRYIRGPFITPSAIIGFYPLLITGRVVFDGKVIMVVRLVYVESGHIDFSTVTDD